MLLVLLVLLVVGPTLTVLLLGVPTVSTAQVHVLLLLMMTMTVTGLGLGLGRLGVLRLAVCGGGLCCRCPMEKWKEQRGIHTKRRV